MANAMAVFLIDEIRGIGGSKKLVLRIYAFPKLGEIFLLLHATNPTDKRFKGHMGVLSVAQFAALAEEFSNHVTDRASLILQGTAVTLKFTPPTHYIGSHHLTIGSELGREGITLNLENRSEVFSNIVKKVSSDAHNAFKISVINFDF